MKHTPTPWRLYRRRTSTKIVENENYANVLEGINSRENYEFIVHAVNMHEELVTLLEECYATINQIGYLSGDKLYHHNLTRIKEVLNKAERKPHGN